MDENYILKRFLYLKYDIVKSDIKTLDRAIKLLCNIDDITNKKYICSVLNYVQGKILSKNVKEAIEKVTLSLYLEKRYDIDKVILSLYQIKSYIIKNKKTYQKYINLIDKM